MEKNHKEKKINTLLTKTRSVSYSTEGRGASSVIKPFIIVSFKLAKLMPNLGSVENFMVN